MDVLTCIKRVPNTGSKIVLTEDQQDIDTTSLGFTMSPHEECGIEEAIQIKEEHGGTATVMTLGPEEATEQLRTGLAMQADEGVLLETDGSEWSPTQTANAIADAVREGSDGDLAYDLLIFGNEAADTADHQVGVRVANRLGLPCITSIKDVTVDADAGTVVAKREIPGGEEVYELDLPAVITVKEGLNTPRYPSMRAKMQARRKEVERIEPERTGGGLEKVRLVSPETDDSPAEILGESADAADDAVRVLRELGVL